LPCARFNVDVAIPMLILIGDSCLQKHTSFLRVELSGCRYPSGRVFF
jgi:hypothetical protein